jgi:hypothetical protein
MEKYLEENIKYKTQILTLFFYLLVANSTGVVGLLLLDNFGSKKIQLLLFFVGFIFDIIFIIICFHLNEQINNNIEKLNKYE